MKELWLDGVYPLKTLEDGRQLKAALVGQKPASALVIGGGYIGLELGLVYAGLGSSVDLVELFPRLLTGADPDLVQRYQRGEAERSRCNHCNECVVEMDRDGVRCVLDDEVA